MVEFTDTAYNNEELFTKWLNEELLKPDVLGGRDSLLVMDHAAFHKTPRILQKLKGTNVVPALVPPGCTSLLQPLDVAINKPFKEWLRRALDEVLDDQDLENSVSNRSALSRRRIAVTRAVGMASDELTRRAELVQQSFVHTGIAIFPNGAEDHKINIKDHPNVDFSGWENFPLVDESIEQQIELEEPEWPDEGLTESNHELFHEVDVLAERTRFYRAFNSVKELKAYCKGLKIKNYSKYTRREDLIQFLVQQDSLGAAESPIDVDDEMDDGEETVGAEFSE